jgi:hypothetical protein
MDSKNSRDKIKRFFLASFFAIVSGGLLGAFGSLIEYGFINYYSVFRGSIIFYITAIFIFVIAN